MRSATIRRGALALGLSTVGLLATTSTAAASTAAASRAAGARPAAAPIAPASGHAPVVAQGVVSSTAGPHHWRLVTNDVGTAPVTVEAASPTFLVAVSDAPDAGPIRISEPDGLGWVLATGEAAFRPAGSTTT